MRDARTLSFILAAALMAFACACVADAYKLRGFFGRAAVRYLVPPAGFSLEPSWLSASGESSWSSTWDASAAVAASSSGSSSLSS